MHSVVIGRRQMSAKAGQSRDTVGPQLGVRTLEIGSDGRLVDLISHVRCSALRASCERISTLSYQILRKTKSISIPVASCVMRRVCVPCGRVACVACGVCGVCAVQETLTTSM